MFAVQFGVSFNNFYLGGQGHAQPQELRVGPQPAHTQAAAQASLPSVSLGHAASGQPAASVPTLTDFLSSGGQTDLSATLQRAGLGVGQSAIAGQPDVAHTLQNPTSAAAEGASPGVTAAIGGNAPLNGAVASSGFLVGAPVLLLPVFVPVQAVGGFTPSALEARPTPPEQIDPIVPEPVTDAPALDPSTTVPETPAAGSAPDAPATPVVQVPADAFDAALRSASRTSVDTELSLSLTTLDGDEIRLEFRQADLATRLGDDAGQSTERLVDISIEGELDEGERAALDDVIDSVIDVADRFLAGDLQGSRQAALDLDFDSSELAELSLRLSVTRSVTVDSAYGGDLAGVRDLLSGSPEAQQVFEVLATEQRRLIDSARETLVDSSAAGLVTGLLPSLLSEPLNRLSERVEGSVEPQPIEDEPEQDA